MSEDFSIRRLAVIGVGLIGGSLALALKRGGWVEEVVGSGRTRANLEVARERGIIDTIAPDAAAAVSGADVVVIGVTLAATGTILEAIAPCLGEDAVVTDVGSVKGSVVDAARRTLGARCAGFVPGHPIAGTERSGAGAAFATLFDSHKVILTPNAETDTKALGRIRAMWERTGARVVEMPVELHDQVLAATSHLPHLLAYTLVDQLAGLADSDAVFEFAAGGFRDFSRIASSSPRMWTEIALANKAALLTLCRDYGRRFEALADALESDDEARIEATFTRAKQARDACVLPESNEPTRS